ncbi:hypothetical protein PG989_010376 [Apiospora arundinis]
MEAAGLALGAIPIILKGIDKYLDLYGEWAKHNVLLATRRRRLKMEQIKLKGTMRILSPGLIEEEIEAELQRCYADDYETIVGTIEDLAKIILELMDTLEIDPQGIPRSSNRLHAEWHRIKRSFKKKEINELLDGISKYNDNLRFCFVGKPEISSDLSVAQTSRQHHSLDKRVCQRIRNEACIIHEALSQAYDRNCANAHINLIDLSWFRQGLRASLLPDLAFPDRESCSQTPQHWHTARIRLEPRPPTLSGGQAGNAGVVTSLTVASASNKGQRKIRFDLSSPGPSRSPSLMPVTCPPLKQRIHSLCSYPTQRLFEGYFLNSDPDNQNMVTFEKTQSANKHVYMLSWREYLTGSVTTPNTSSRRFQRKKMSVKDRLAIASAASWAVLLLCDTPWLERTRMIEDDLVLLTEEKLHNRSPEELERANAVPAFSYQFKAPDQAIAGNAETDGRASNASDAIAIPHRTLFALAVLLLEIGLDRDFRSLYEEFGSETTPFRGFEDKESLIESYQVASAAAERLYFEMSNSYADAVKRCIQFNFTGPRSLQHFRNETLRQQFFNGVVEPVHQRYELEQTRHRLFRAG